MAEARDSGVGRLGSGASTRAFANCGISRASAYSSSILSWRCRFRNPQKGSWNQGLTVFAAPAKSRSHSAGSGQALHFACALLREPRAPVGMTEFPGITEIEVGPAGWNLALGVLV